MADINDESFVKEKKEEMSPVKSNSELEPEDKVKNEEDDNDSGDVKNEDLKKDEANDEEDGSEEEEEDDEELPPGLLEQPLEVSGKREKKKVDRLSATMAVGQSTEKKKLEIEEGSGVKLGDIAFIEKQVNATKASDLKSLHRLLFLRIGSQYEIKKNIRQFCGFVHSKESKEHERRMVQLNKMHLVELKSICSVLALEKSGTKKDIIDRIIEFLMEPVDKGIKVPQSKRAKNKAKAEAKNDKKKVKKRKRAPKQSKKKEENEDEELDDDVSDEDEKDMSEQEIEEESDEEPPKKKAKAEPKKKTSPKVNGKKEKSPKKKEPKKVAPKAAKEMSDLSDDSDSDDEPIAKLKKPTPPTNDEIKDLVKKILDGADLESVTMKTVVKEVYSKYPTFDLSDRKDFIKTTVREVIS